MKLSVVIPVYNEKKTIEQIIESVRSVTGIDKEIVVVDDFSTDGTRSILSGIATKYPEVKVYFKEFNSGKGATLREAFSHTTGDLVIVQDADLEYDPKDYSVLVEAYNKSGGKTVIYGSRFSGTYQDMTSLHYHGNKVLTMITNFLFGTSLTDMETCYKLLPGSFAREVKIISNRFNFEPEITAKILKSGFKIIEVPITYKGRSFSEGKKITWRDGISALYTLIRFRIAN